MSYKQQEQALVLLKEFSLSKHQIFRLSGYSGTGKSYLMRLFLEWYRSQFPDHSFVVIAPSNKAKRNIGDILTGICEPITISSYLGLTPQLDQSTGEITFGANKDKNFGIPPEDVELVVCDEYSMVSKDNVAELNDRSTKIIYLGDPAQLPPIGEDMGSVSLLKCPSYQLTDVVRYSGDLARVAATWRVDQPVEIGGGATVTLKTISKPLPIKTTPDGTILSLSKFTWITQYCSDVSNGKNTKLLTFTNRACGKWNQFVRSELYGSEQFYTGEKLIAKAPLFRISTNNGRLETVVNNSTEFTIDGIPRLSALKLHYVEYEYSTVPAVTEDGLSIDLFILTPASQALQARVLDNLRNQALAATGIYRARYWGQWHELKKTFDDVTYAYAITCHKAQGSTFDAAYLDMFDLMKCSDQRRIIYTAATRSKQVYIYE
jgi:hypothetical protein